MGRHSASYIAAQQALSTVHPRSRRSSTYVGRVGLLAVALGIGAAVAGGTAVAGAAVSSPFTLPDAGMGPQQWLMVAAGVLLLGAVIVPPLASRRLKRAGRDS